MINRRDFLKNASLFTLGGLMAGKVGSADAANLSLLKRWPLRQLVYKSIL